MRLLAIFVCFGLVLLLAAPLAKAAGPDYGNAQRLSLPAPDKSGGVPLMQALAQRQSNRNISEEAISQQELSNLLWAAWGVNRPDGKHTVPTARNKQMVAVYAAMDSGVWYYDSTRHELALALAQDIRRQMGGAPLVLIYAASKSDEASPMHVGSIYQNVGLYCASAGLANVVKGSGVAELNAMLPLPENYAVFILHPVGKPK